MKFKIHLDLYLQNMPHQPTEEENFLRGRSIFQQMFARYKQMNLKRLLKRNVNAQTESVDIKTNRMNTEEKYKLILLRINLK